MTRPVWQVAGGLADSSVAATFLRHGVALVGPGDAGPWRSGGNEALRRVEVRRFAEDVAIGDALLQKTVA